MPSDFDPNMFKCPWCSKAFKTEQKATAHTFSAHVRVRTLKKIVHDTVAGYSAHKRRKETPCADCRKAWREYYQKKRSSIGK